MKALREIGFARAAKFVFGRFVAAALSLCVLPQLRVVLLRLLGARIGRDAVVHNIEFMNYYRGSFRNLTLGDCCFVGPGCLLDLAAPIDCGDHVTLAARVTVLTHMNVGYGEHPLQAEFPARVHGVTIGTGSFIGANATVLCGTEVGEGCFVGAGAVVNRSLDAGTVAGGVPARPVRSLCLPEDAPSPELVEPADDTEVVPPCLMPDQ